jgi:hypothetical protein
MKKLFSRSIMILAMLAFVASSLWFPSSVRAFNNNNIMDDSVFDDATSMSSGQIDSWLNGFPGSCISPNNGFMARVPNGYSPSGGFTYGGNGSAGQVIAAAAQVYGINPRVILVTLQKEQSLVTGSAGCGVNRISKAAGYGCPDGGSSYSYSGLNLYTLNGTTYTSVDGICVNSAVKAGFSQQVIRAAWLLKFSQQRSLGDTGWAVITGSWDNSDDPGTCYGGAMTQGYRKRCSSDANAVFYDGYTTIDSTTIHIDTGATAALYRYTPHFSGNTNFFNLYNSWFGSTYGDVIGAASYRLWNPQTRHHLFTTRENERATAKQKGFRDDGTAVFKTSATQEAGMIPIYHLYNGRLKDDWLLPDGPNLYWAAIYGGYGIQNVAFYAYPANPNPTPSSPVCSSGGTALYQMWQGGAAEHFYSVNGGDHYWALVYGGYVDDGSSHYKDGNGGVSFCVPQ